MDRKAYCKWLFIVAALWNWLASIPFFFWHDKIYARLNLQALNYPAVLQLAMALVFVFGIGYFWVSKDISRNHDIVKLGAIAKIIAFFIFAYHYLFGSMPLVIVACGVIDLIFAILFIEFLTRNRHASRA